MSVLGKYAILKALAQDKLEERLVVTPLLDPDQIGEASIDMRLAHDFMTVRRGNVDAFDPHLWDTRTHRYRAHHRLNKGDKFFLHPAEMALAATLEYVRLPTTLSAFVTSRSKWGRLGLVIATATAIHPGFTGTITLELVNHGNVPLVLYPGLMVVQLILHDAREAAPYEGHLSKQTGVFAGDSGRKWQNDMDFWVKK